MKLGDGDAESVVRCMAGPIVEWAFGIGVDVVSVSTMRDVQHDGQAPAAKGRRILMEPAQAIVVGRQGVWLYPTTDTYGEFVEAKRPQVDGQVCLHRAVPDHHFPTAASITQIGPDGKHFFPRAEKVT